MRKKIGFSLFFLGLLAIAFTGCKKTKDFIDPAKILPPAVTKGVAYYVSDLIGSDANTGFLSTAPLKTITAGYNKLAAGDTLYIMNGTYTNAGTSILNVTKSGNVNQYITFKNFPGHSPKFVVSGDVWNAVVINGSYVIFDGIEMQGDNANLTYAAAFTAYTDARASGVTNANAKFNTNAISIGGPAAESKLPHHVVIRNCKVHDFPGGGISSIQADYTTIEGNTIYNNAWYMMYGGSGISILCPINSDAPDVLKYKNIVRNNTCYNNKTTIPWISTGNLSDGNGIIIDINVYPYNQPSITNKPYTGRTLVENNVSYNNGGSGIHSYFSDHIDIINNTVFSNGNIMTGYPDLFGNRSNDVKIMNNIVYSRTGNKCNSAPTAGYTTVYNYNIYYNGTVGFSGANDKTVNPGLVNASIDPLLANFTLSAGSPAIDAGTQTIYSAKDKNGVARPKGAGVDCGAYEY